MMFFHKTMMETEKIKKWRQDFNQRVEQILSKPQNNYAHWDKKRIKEAIGELDEDQPTWKPHSNYSGLYKVSDIDGEKVLLNRTHSSKIIPNEEYFDVLYAAHLATRHGKRSKLRTYLINANPKNRVYVPDLAIRIFPRTCPNCKIAKFTRRLSVPLKSRNFRRGFVNIINMSLDPDQNYQYILHYQDYETLFSHLRPLEDDETITVFNELLKIFLTLGSPAILYSPLGRKFLEGVVKLFHKENACHQIIIGRDIKEDDQTPKIADKVMLWMTQTMSTNWSIGVYYVQHDMNSSVGKNNRIPYKEMFDVLPKLGLDTTGMPEDVIKSLTEEKLVEWRKNHKQSGKPEHDETGCSEEVEPGGVLNKIKLEDDNSEELPTANPEMEGTMCWVCDEYEEPATATCNQCCSLIHIKCGIFHSDSETITCIICMDDSPLENIDNDDEELEFKIDIKEEPLIRGCREETAELSETPIKEEPMEE